MSRRRLALVALLVATPILAGCGAGVRAQTNIQGPSGNGASARVGTLVVNGMNLVVPPSAKTTSTPGDASLMLRVFNGGDQDQLTGVVLPTGVATDVVTPRVAAITTGSGTQALAVSTARFVPIEVPASGNVGIGQDGLIPAIKVVGLKSEASAWIDVTLQFKNAGNVTVPVLVVPSAGYNAGVPVPRS